MGRIFRPFYIKGFYKCKNIVRNQLHTDDFVNFGVFLRGQNDVLLRKINMLDV